MMDYLWTVTILRFLRAATVIHDKVVQVEIPHVYALPHVKHDISSCVDETNGTYLGRWIRNVRVPII